MSSPTFVNGASNTMSTAGAGPMSANVPASVADGDLLIGHISIAHLTVTPTPPAGWTFIGSRQTQFAAQFVYARIASSEPASYSWSVSGAVEWNIIHHAYRPSSGSWATVFDAIAAIDFRSAGSSTSPPFDAIPLPASMDCMLVTFLALGRGASCTAPSGYTKNQEPNSGGSGSGATVSCGAYKSVTAGTAPGGTWSVGNSGTSTTCHILLVDGNTALPMVLRAWMPTIGTTTTDTSISVTLPPARPGDILMVALNMIDPRTVTTPSGWTAGPVGTVSGADTVAILYKVASGSEGTSLSISVSSGTTMNASAYAFTGVGAVLATNSGSDTTLDTAANVAALTMAAASPGALVVTVAASERGDRTFDSPPSGYNMIGNTADENTVRNGSTSGRPAHAGAYKYETGANPAPGSFTMNLSATNASATVALGVAATAKARSYGFVVA